MAVTGQSLIDSGMLERKVTGRMACFSEPRRRSKASRPSPPPRSHRVGVARGDDEVVRRVELQHRPHGLHEVAGVAPVADGVEVAAGCGQIPTNESELVPIRGCGRLGKRWIG